MRTNRRMSVAGVAWGIAFIVAVVSARAQVGKSQGVIDINTASEKDLSSLPHMTSESVKAIMDVRPFESIVALNRVLLSQGLTPKQAGEVYAKAFVQINLNTATREEIMLIPGAGRKMSHEFAEYRPWRNWAQFGKEIGKYVGKVETARLAQYCFIPLNVNKATDEDLATIPGLKTQTIEQISKGKPWKTVEDVRSAIAKMSGEKEASRITRYLVVG
ncbi:MAG TPA: helix-hairpin-helix domain-containing protein [Phycisphaerae bacterium]|nr:helix-hairpin-helix domain-containing protein [Phycisphaerae bacterium]